MKWFLSAAVMLVLVELGVRHWRGSAPVSEAPVWSLPMVTEAMRDPGEFQRAIDVYRADRGAELALETPEGENLTVFYFEWDRVEAGPMADITGHTPDECNVAYGGLTLEAKHPSRNHVFGDGERLTFDASTLTGPGGKTFHVFKGAWMQGVGSWDLRSAGDRLTRMSLSFSPAVGQARVLQGGVAGAETEAAAWEVFQNQVLETLTWSSQ